MEPPIYSPQARIDLPDDHVDASPRTNEEEEVVLPTQSGAGKGSDSSSTEESLHFSDRVERDDEEPVLRDGKELVLDDEAQDLPEVAAGTCAEEGNTKTSIDIEALVARITKEQEERFQQRMAEQARRFGVLLAQAMAGEDGSRGAAEDRVEHDV
jgi:hypothetical protein